MASPYSARVTLDRAATAEPRLPLTTQLGMLLRVAHARAGRRANEALRPSGWRAATSVYFSCSIGPAH